MFSLFYLELKMKISDRSDIGLWESMWYFDTSQHAKFQKGSLDRSNDSFFLKEILKK